MQILTEDEAILIFGPLDQVIFIEGLSLILYDVSQFMHVGKFSFFSFFQGYLNDGHNSIIITGGPKLF
jgi:hypothetical protein